MNLSVNIKKALESRLLIIGLLLIFLLVGLSVYGDFGIGIDEPIERMTGLVVLKYIIGKLTFHANTEGFLSNIPNLSDYHDKYFGAVFNLPISLLEVGFGIRDPRQFYLLKHLANFLLFFASLIVFYRFLYDVFENRMLSLIGVCFLIFSPRIFAHSFVNPKDIPLLSFVIFSTYFNVKFLNSDKKMHLILSALFTSLAIGVRMIVFYIPMLTLLFYLFKIDEKNKRLILINAFFYLILTLVLIVLFWPVLWSNPVTQFMQAFGQFKQRNSVPELLYFGEYIPSSHIPWHYFFTWFLITTPCIFSLIILLGVFKSFKLFFSNLLNVEHIPHHALWRNSGEMNCLYMFFVVAAPLCAVIVFNSTLYNGWRHLYFVYPATVFLGIAFLDYVLSCKKGLYINLCYFLIATQILFSAIFMFRSHPNQQVYFNVLARHLIPHIDKKFPIDYWGLSNHVAIKRLLADVDHSNPIRIGKASWTVDLDKTRLILKKNIRSAYTNVWGDFRNADFILTNDFYPYNPRVKPKAYAVPDNFSSYAKLKVNGVLVNEIFKKNTKESS